MSDFLCVNRSHFNDLTTLPSLQGEEAVHHQFAKHFIFHFNIVSFIIKDVILPLLPQKGRSGALSL